jgi:hypothetical protein
LLDIDVFYVAYRMNRPASLPNEIIGQ